MLHRLAALYCRRIINVNVNVIAAGLIALLPVLICVHLTELALAKGIVDGDRLHVSDKLIIGGVTFVSDIVFDVVIYYLLHWLANHAPWLKAQRLKQIEAVADAAVESSPFFKDATRVQIQRAVLSPLLYILWIGTQQFLMHAYMFSTKWSTVWGFLVGVGIARTLHTFWMLREEAAKRDALAADKLNALRTIDLPKADPHPIWERSKDLHKNETARSIRASASTEPKVAAAEQATRASPTPSRPAASGAGRSTD